MFARPTAVRFALLAAIALPLGTAQADSLSSAPPPPEDAAQAVVYDVRTGTSRAFASPPSRGRGGGTAYPGGDLQGTLFGLGELEPVSDPLQYPARVNVSFLVQFSASIGVCSGTLIDARHVITAAHCVYKGGWPDSLSVTAAGSLVYGTAEAIHVTAFKGWTEYELWNWDVALITLDRPIGALTGWHGYGTTSCHYMTHNDFEGYAFPGEGPFNGDMVYWDGTFDWCPATYQVQTNDTGYKGMSGSTVYNPDSFHVRAVFSTLYSAWPQGTRYVRLVNATAEAFYDVIHSTRPNSPDLIPVGFEMEKGQVTPEGGQIVEVTGIHVHNYSDVDFQGELTVHVKLSTNDKISKNDKTVWSQSGEYSIQAMHSLMVDPADITIPHDVAPGLYYIGVWLEVDDADPSNNEGTDRLFNEIAWLIINDTAPDLEAVEVSVPDGVYSDWADLPITFEVTNRGNLPTAAWTGQFYLSPSWIFSSEAILIGDGGSENLAPGQSYLHTVWLPLDGVPAGDYYVHLRVDTEGDAGLYHNGARTSNRITVDDITGLAGPPPDLRVDYLGVDAGTYNAAELAPAAFSVTNGGTGAGLWHAHFFALNAFGDIVHLTSGSAGGLLAGASFEALEKVPLKGLDPGLWWLAISVETDQETYLDDNWRIAPAELEIEKGLKLTPSG